VVELISIFYNMADIFLIESMLGSEVFARYIYSYKLILATLIFYTTMVHIFWAYVGRLTFAREKILGQTKELPGTYSFLIRGLPSN